MAAESRGLINDKLHGLAACAGSGVVAVTHADQPFSIAGEQLPGAALTGLANGQHMHDIPLVVLFLVVTELTPGHHQSASIGWVSHPQAAFESRVERANHLLPGFPLSRE